MDPNKPIRLKIISMGDAEVGKVSSTISKWLQLFVTAVPLQQARWYWTWDQVEPWQVTTECI